MNHNPTEGYDKGIMSLSGKDWAHSQIVYIRMQNHKLCHIDTLSKSVQGLRDMHLERHPGFMWYAFGRLTRSLQLQLESSASARTRWQFSTQNSSSFLDTQVPGTKQALVIIWAHGCVPLRRIQSNLSGTQQSMFSFVNIQITYAIIGLRLKLKNLKT